MIAAGLFVVAGVLYVLASMYRERTGHGRAGAMLSGALICTVLVAATLSAVHMITSVT